MSFKSVSIQVLVLACLVAAGCETKPAAPAAAPGTPAAASTTVPKGLPAVPVPADNPMTAEKIELGKLLYFDKRLSKDGTVACATCHDPKSGWAETTPTSTGIGHQVGDRNSPTVVNAAYMDVMFWDGRAKSLEEQALGPIENSIEMGHKMELLIPELAKIPDYAKRFKAVFGKDEITKDMVAKAIACFERTILSGDSPYDRHVAGDAKALTESGKKGLETFNKAGCNGCHSGAVFSNSRYYNAGVGAPADPGRKKVTGKDEDMGKFRVPALREVASTGPYFHDGSAKTLEEAVDLMVAGGKDDPNLSDMLKSVREAKLAGQDKKDIVEFLKSLSGKYPIVEEPKLP
jgi:cytochrome c peroxidase